MVGPLGICLAWDAKRATIGRNSTRKVSETLAGPHDGKTAFADADVAVIRSLRDILNKKDRGS